MGHSRACTKRFKMDALNYVEKFRSKPEDVIVKHNDESSKLHCYYFSL